MQLKQTTAHKQSLVRPEDDFYPIEVYTRLFGCPKDSKNKKRGHRISIINGIRGVVVPGENTDRPWKLVRSVDGSIEMHEEHDNGDGSDGEVEADVMQRKFSEIVEEQEQAYQASSVGVMASIFTQTCGPSGQPDAPTSQSTCGKIVNSGSAVPTVASASAPAVDDEGGRKRRCAIEEAEDYMPPGKGCGKGNKQSKRPVSGASGGWIASSRSRGKSSGGPVSPTKGELDDDKGDKKRGRPELDILVITERQWEAFSRAQEGDLFSVRGRMCNSDPSNGMHLLQDKRLLVRPLRRSRATPKVRKVPDH